MLPPKLVKQKKTRKLIFDIDSNLSLVIRQLAALPVPPRSVIIERLPAAPARPRKSFLSSIIDDNLLNY